LFLFYSIQNVKIGVFQIYYCFRQGVIHVRQSETRVLNVKTRDLFKETPTRQIKRSTYQNKIL